MNSFKKKSKKIKKKRDKKDKKDRKRSRKNSSSSSTSSSDSSIMSSSSSSSNSDRHKQKKRKHKKDHKRKKSKRYEEKSIGESSKSQTIEITQNQQKSDDDDFNIPIHLMDSKQKAPETKEEYEKRQSVLRRVVDEETGRTRLIKGDGEVIEEMVSRDRHREINKQATQTDGQTYHSKMIGWAVTSNKK